MLQRLFLSNVFKISEKYHWDEQIEYSPKINLYCVLIYTEKEIYRKKRLMHFRKIWLILFPITRKFDYWTLQKLENHGNILLVSSVNQLLFQVQIILQNGKKQFHMIRLMNFQVIIFLYHLIQQLFLHSRYKYYSRVERKNCKEINTLTFTVMLCPYFEYM